MREINMERIVDTVSQLCREACLIHPDYVTQCTSPALMKEQSPAVSQCMPQ
ncbi:MAG: hypothetical protein AB2L14_07990 [Candidatus Xenobiia bacterium LiM19]